LAEIGKFVHDALMTPAPAPNSLMPLIKLLLRGAFRRARARVRWLRHVPTLVLSTARHGVTLSRAVQQRDAAIAQLIEENRLLREQMETAARDRTAAGGDAFAAADQTPDHPAGAAPKRRAAAAGWWARLLGHARAQYRITPKKATVDSPPATAAPGEQPEPGHNAPAAEPGASNGKDDADGNGASEPRLQHLPHIPVRYDARREPSVFRYQDPRSFLFGSEVTNWSYAERAPFFTEFDLKGRFNFMQAAAAYLFGIGIKGDYHEYGCYSANTFRMFLTWAAMYDLPISRFWAFDSFQGLPAPDEQVSLASWKQGTMRMSEEDFWSAIAKHGVFVDRVHTIRGFYADTLTTTRQTEFVEQQQPIAFANIDCDLYRSALDVFRFIDPLLQEGSLIYLDDFFVGYRGSPKKGVAGAFREFIDEGRWRAQEFLTVGAWGKSFIVYPKD
jgi:hypothetical protein